MMAKTDATHGRLECQSTAVTIDTKENKSTKLFKYQLEKSNGT
ncbi:hypothetical protein P4K96_20200 [Bacillus cereus]|nr:MULTISPECIES: hypothetical protein [Paenibacillus]MEB9895794.1 hypothetical protein [Bacillus cereus]